MRICDIHPSEDGRWDECLQALRAATMFHTASWLKVIHNTYGWDSRVLAIVDDNGVVTGGVPYFAINSAIAGRRIVSVPFSDYCHPLCENNDELTSVLRALRQIAYQGRVDAVQMRGIASEEVATQEGWVPGARFVSHKIWLTDGIEATEQRYHKDCVQRKIRKAVREGVQIERGNRSEMVDQFYALLVRTRRRHGYPPPPKRWLVNVAECVPGADYLMCSYQGKPVAGVVTIRWKDTLYYKYGASDERFHHLGAMPLVYREMIRRAAEEGVQNVDLGRTELSNRGLAEFKERFGAVPTMVQYWECGAVRRREGRLFGAVWNVGRAAISRLPLFVLPSIGNAVYPHIA